ncbi:MAG: maleylpyruvate isomerase family mycothiol-dependent enzyme [Chloroflexota bacterium]
MAINPMDYSGKDVVLDVIRTERGRFYEVIDNPDNWKVDTRCEGWQVRDMVGHMIDVTEGYLDRWEKARKGQDAPVLGLLAMAETLNEHALALRSLSRDEAISRLKTASDKMMNIFDNLSVAEWGGFNVTHTFMGPLPTLFYTAFHVMDYGVHTWDMHWGLGDKEAKIDERTAGVLVPYMFILMQATLDQKAAKGVDITYGIKVDGEWGGQWKITVKDGQFNYTAVDDLSNAPAVLHFKHPSDMVLTAFQRIQGGETSGDMEVIKKVRGLFFRI